MKRFIIVSHLKEMIVTNKLSTPVMRVYGASGMRRGNQKISLISPSPYWECMLRRHSGVWGYMRECISFAWASALQSQESLTNRWREIRDENISAESLAANFYVGHSTGGAGPSSL